MVLEVEGPGSGPALLRIRRTGGRAMLRYGRTRAIQRDVWRGDDGSAWMQYSNQWNEVVPAGEGWFANSFDTRHGRAYRPPTA